MSDTTWRPRGLPNRGLLLAAIAVAQAPIALTAWSAERASGAEPIEEVLVTARRREEALQDVPATVSVVTGQEMFVTGNDSMDKLRDVIPNFNFASDMAYRSRVAVRGLGSDRSGAQTNGVGFFIDGVYQSGTSRLNAPFFDVERVEVLKGPQGARYGRNSFAGVVNVVTRKPDNEFRSSVQASGENRGTYEYAGMIAGPLIEDKLYGKLSFAHNESDGDYKNARTGKDQVPMESDFYNARLIWDVTERFELDLQLGKMDNDGIAYAFSQTTDPNDPVENYLVDDDQTSGYDSDEGSLTATWTLDSFEIMNRISYRDDLSHLGLDAEVTQYHGAFAIVKVDSEHWSEELRIQSVGGGRLHWMFGGEYVDTDSDAIFDTYFYDPVDVALAFPGCVDCEIYFGTGLTGLWFGQLLNSISPSSNTIDGSAKTWAVFGELSYEFFDRLEATVSLRYDDIDKDVFNASGGVNSAGLGLDYKDDAWQPLFSLRYSLDDNTSVYASAARGIREGGFNSSALSKDYAIFEMDDVWSYEVGFKKTFPEYGAYLNLSLFYMDADTLNQAAIIITDAGNLANGAITMGGADSYGLELDFGMPLGGGIDWTAALGLLDCTLKGVPPYGDRSDDTKQVSPGVTNGNTCQDSSEWTLYTALNGEWALGGSGWSATASVSLSAKGDTRLTTDAGVPGLTAPADSAFPCYACGPAPESEVLARTFREWAEIRDPLYLVNFSAGVRNQNWTVVGYVENATNKRYAVDNFSHEGLADSTIFGLGEGNFITTLAPKRRYGLRVRYDL